MDNEFKYGEARKSLGLTIQQMADAVSMPIGLWSMVETGEKKPPLAVHHYIIALLEGFRPPDWPIAVERPPEKFYMVECDLTDKIHWIPIRATDPKDAKLKLALTSRIHVGRMLTVKEVI